MICIESMSNNQLIQWTQETTYIYSILLCGVITPIQALHLTTEKTATGFIVVTWVSTRKVQVPAAFSSSTGLSSTANKMCFSYSYLNSTIKNK